MQNEQHGRTYNKKNARMASGHEHGKLKEQAETDHAFSLTSR
jgi:hypothetical protein